MSDMQDFMDGFEDGWHGRKLDRRTPIYTHAYQKGVTGRAEADYWEKRKAS